MSPQEKSFRRRAFAARWLGMHWVVNKKRFGITYLDVPYASARSLTGPDCRGWRIASSDELRSFIAKYTPPASVPLLAYDSSAREGLLARGADTSVIQEDPLPARHVCVLVVQEPGFSPSKDDELLGMLDEKFPGKMDTFIPYDILK